MRKKIIVIFTLIILITSGLVECVFATERHIDEPVITLYSKRFDGLFDTEIKNEVYEYLRDNYGYSGNTLRYTMKINTTAKITNKNLLRKVYCNNRKQRISITK